MGCKYEFKLQYAVCSMQYAVCILYLPDKKCWFGYYGQPMLEFISIPVVLWLSNKASLA